MKVYHLITSLLFIFLLSTSLHAKEYAFPAFEAAQLTLDLKTGSTKDRLVYISKEGIIHALVPHHSQRIYDDAADLKYKYSVTTTPLPDWKIIEEKLGTTGTYEVTKMTDADKIPEATEKLIYRVKLERKVHIEGNPDDYANDNSHEAELNFQEYCIILYTPSIQLTLHTPSKHDSLGEKIKRPTTKKADTVKGFNTGYLGVMLRNEDNDDGVPIPIAPNAKFPRDNDDDEPKAKDDDLVAVKLELNLPNGMPDELKVMVKLNLSFKFSSQKQIRIFDSDKMVIPHQELKDGKTLDAPGSDKHLSELIKNGKAIIYLEGRGNDTKTAANRWGDKADQITLKLTPNGNFKEASSHGLLLPIVLWDINGAGKKDDLTIIHKIADQNIAKENIAWIDAHTSDVDDAPRMPQLELRTPMLPRLPKKVKFEAKLEVQYTRGNGSRSTRKVAEDKVKIPANGKFKKLDKDEWGLYIDDDWKNELANAGFFGGEATLTYKISRGEDIILKPTEIKFRIGGKNPDDDKTKDYIESKPNAGPGGNLWFTYAIVKSESANYNGNGSRYNQFLELPTHRRDFGRPLWGNDGGNTPGGYGMIQVTKNIDIPRKQLWDWRENIIGGLEIINGKRTEADNWMTRQRNGDNANGVALPEHTVGPVTFSEGTARTMNDAVTIKLYNGASRPPAGTDAGNVPGFELHNQSGHYCFWRNATSRWALNRFNNPPGDIDPFNYVDRVSQEVEN